MKPKLLKLLLAFVVLLALFFGLRGSSTNVVASEFTDLAPFAQKDTTLGVLGFSSGTNRTYYMEGEATVYQYIELKADHYIPDAQSRVPLNLCLVIDRSGSMEGDKLKYVLEAVAFVIDNLGAEDRLSMVTYDHEVNVLLEPTAIENKQQIKRLLEQVYSRGSTNLSGGLHKGYDLIKNNFKSGYVNRVLLLTDGLANEGIVNPDLIANMADQMNKEFAVTLSTFGVGLDFNESLLMDLSEKGTGNYYFIENPDRIPNIFSMELEGLLAVVAQNVSLEIDEPQGASVEMVYGYHATEHEGQWRVNLRDVVSDEKKGILLRWKIEGRADSYVFKTRLKFLDAVHAVSEQSELAPEVQRTTEAQIYRDGLDSAIEAQVLLFRSNDLFVRTMRAVDDGDYNLASSLTSENCILLSNVRSYGLFDSSLITQDSLVQNYDSTIVRPLKNGIHISRGYFKSSQKSNKATNHFLKKKKKY